MSRKAIIAFVLTAVAIMAGLVFVAVDEAEKNAIAVKEFDAKKMLERQQAEEQERVRQVKEDESAKESEARRLDELDSGIWLSSGRNACRKTTTTGQLQDNVNALVDNGKGQVIHQSEDGARFALTIVAQETKSVTFLILATTNLRCEEEKKLIAESNSPYSGYSPPCSGVLGNR